MALVDALITARIRRFRSRRQSESGVAAVEFALVLPVLVVLFIGLVEFTEAFSITRKLSNSASTVSDLVAQEATVSTGSLNDIMTVADEIMAPYSSAPLSMIVLSVAADEDENVTVEWSHPSDGTYNTGDSYSSLPQSALLQPNTSLVVVEATYDFTPTISQFLGSFQLNERAYFRPRLGRITKTD